MTGRCVFTQSQHLTPLNSQQQQSQEPLSVVTTSTPSTIMNDSMLIASNLTTIIPDLVQPPINTDHSNDKATEPAMKRQRLNDGGCKDVSNWNHCNIPPNV